MSKAFVNEDLIVGESEHLPQRPSEPLPITPRGQRVLRAQLDALRDKGARGTRPERVLMHILDTVVVRAPARQARGAGFGCVVDVQRADGTVHSHHIVGPDEASPREGLISVTSPLARALLGHGEGETVLVEKPQGDEQLTILAVHVPNDS